MLNEIAKVGIVFFIAFVVLSWLTPYDNTDNASAGKRSGLNLYTDHLTGCQYVKAGWFSNLVPRMDGSGKQVGCRP